jgi:predicted short-subunit dehydrogenase-like oxidoreductase (DUF2520 family)
MSAPPRPPGEARPLTVAVIGAGRVGAVLAAALRRAGHRIVAAAGSRAAELLPDVPLLTPAEVARTGADLLLLAVPDDVLTVVAAGLAPTGGQAVAHTSGAHGLDVPHATLALHPAMTFTGTAADLDRLPGVAWGVTARDRALAARLVADLGGVPEWIGDDARPLYHAALAHGANHLVTLVNEAADLLRAAGVADPATVLRPLLTAALDNALRLGDAALTGPVSRADTGTVARHLAVLPPASRPAYRTLAHRTAERAAAAARLTPAEARRLTDLLDGAATDGAATDGAATDVAATDGAATDGEAA